VPGKSLVEEHRQARREQELAARKRKRDEKHGSERTKEQEEPGQTWVHFDRERDLKAPKESKSKYQAMLDGQSSLSTRFKRG
jgi:hypothetical protein